MLMCLYASGIADFTAELGKISRGPNSNSQVAF
jgi:hypothetical protein